MKHNSNPGRRLANRAKLRVPTRALSSWPLLRVVNEGFTKTAVYSSRTLSNYRCSIRTFERLCGGTVAAKNVSEERIVAFVKWMEAEGARPYLIKQKVDAIASVVRFVNPLILASRNNVGRVNFSDASAANSIERYLVDDYFPAKSKIASKETIRQYGLAVARLSRYLGRFALLSDLNDQTIGRWMREMREEGLQARTINGYMGDIRAFWTWAARRRLVDEFPTIENAPVPRRIPRCWTKDQLASLIQAASKMKGNVGGVDAGAWWRAFHLVAWDTGERTSALLSIEWNYLDAVGGDLEVPAEIRKGGKKPMLYKLKPATLDALNEIREPERREIFHWEGHRTNFYHSYKRLLKIAGLPYEVGRSGPQKIRRSFASFIEAAGGNATAALDHSKRQLTVDSYLDPRVVVKAPPNVLLFDIQSTQ